jgi:hypothetical protein
VRVAPLLPGAPSRLQPGAFILHLPVTTLEARELGLALYGLPKFVADMDFDEEPSCRRVRLSEGNADILTLTVRPAGPVTVDRKPSVLYSVLHGELLQTTVSVLGHSQTRTGAAGGQLKLGEHPVADGLRELEISPEPLVTTSYLDHRAILPVGLPVGTADDYTGYSGVDRDRGRYTVRYADAEPIDKYAASIPRTMPEPVHVR